MRHGSLHMNFIYMPAKFQVAKHTFVKDITVQKKCQHFSFLNLRSQSFHL